MLFFIVSYAIIWHYYTVYVLVDLFYFFFQWADENTNNALVHVLPLALYIVYAHMQYNIYSRFCESID